jgi:hypothetical protein
MTRTLVLGSPTVSGARGIGDERRSIAGPADIRRDAGIVLFLG